MRILVTGGAGFIGSALVRHLIGESEHDVHVLDKLTYAGQMASLQPVSAHQRFNFTRGDICDSSLINRLLADFSPDIVVNLAAETHVDRSIDTPGSFIETNVNGTYTLLDAARTYWGRLAGERKERFRFHHISTDEVFGSLGESGFFTEESPYQPRSPYSASKAASDHLVRAWAHTYGLPTLITNASNNYGPYQFPEKLMPLMIMKALTGEKLPVYGRGENVRDWLFIDDHVRALRLVFEKGAPQSTYNLGGNAERKNIDVVRTLCALLDDMSPRGDGKSYAEQISFVVDRPGHDARYAIDGARIRRDLGWSPQEDFTSGLRKTVRWYLDNQAWLHAIRSETYAGARLGVIAG